MLPDCVKVKISGMSRKGSGSMHIHKRKPISELTHGSVRRLGEVLSFMAPIMQSLITLTYPSDYPLDGRAVKRHLKRLIEWLLYHECGNYVWILEFQDRGAPHFHIVVDRFIGKKALSEAWFRIVGSGDDKHLSAGTQIESIRSKGGLSHYLKAYIYKQAQKDVPVEFQSVGRFWGNNRELVRPLAQITYASDTSVKVKASVRPLRKLFDSKRRKKGRSKVRGESRQKGFTVYTNEPEKLLRQFLSYNDGKNNTCLEV